jgi:hypothetical protein
MNERLSGENKGYILCKCFTRVIDLFVSTFLVAYFLKITSGNIFQISMYYALLYVAQTISYFLISLLFPKIDKLVFYRLSIILQCVFLMMIALLKENIVNYIAPIALFYGFSGGMYWSSFNLLVNQGVSSKNMQRFYGIYHMSANITSIVAPIILGYIIDVDSFVQTSIYAFIIGLILFACTFLIVSRKEKHTHLDIKGYFKTVKESEYKKDFMMINLISLTNGLRVTMATLVTILTIRSFGTNLSLGSITSITSILSIFVTYLVMKKYSYKKRNVILGCLSIIAFSVIMLLLDINRLTVIMINIVYTLATIPMNNLFCQRRMSTIRITKHLDYSLEYNLIAEILLNSGRAIAYFSLMIASLANTTNIYKTLLIVNLICIILFSITIYVYEIRYQKIAYKKDTIDHLKNIEKDIQNSTYYHEMIAKQSDF